MVQAADSEQVLAVEAKEPCGDTRVQGHDYSWGHLRNQSNARQHVHTEYQRLHLVGSDHKEGRRSVEVQEGSLVT